MIAPIRRNGRLTRWTRHVIGASAVAALLALWGCSREQPPKLKTPAQVRAEIQKVETDTKMPAKVKGMVLGLLRKELEQAEKAQKSR